MNIKICHPSLAAKLLHHFNAKMFIFFSSESLSVYQICYKKCTLKTIYSKRNPVFKIYTLKTESLDSKLCTFVMFAFNSLISFLAVNSDPNSFMRHHCMNEQCNPSCILGSVLVQECISHLHYLDLILSTSLLFVRTRYTDPSAVYVSA